MHQGTPEASEKIIQLLGKEFDLLGVFIPLAGEAFVRCLELFVFTSERSNKFVRVSDHVAE